MLHSQTCAHLPAVNGSVKGKDAWKEEELGGSVCLLCVSVGSDSIRQSHTQLHSPGDFCQPVILLCTPPSLVLLTAEIGQPHIMEGQ